MTKWNASQLEAFATADDMHISPFYDDGKTYGTPTFIWSVVADGNLYVRAYNGQHSSWYQSAIKQGAGKIKLAGQEFEVTFKSAAGNSQLDAKINQAYQDKYGSSPYYPPMVEAGPVSATVEIDPK